MTSSEFIKNAAIDAGFDACGIARAEFLADDAEFLENWLALEKHGNMHYLARNFEKRTNPQLLVPGCKSVVVVLHNYYPSQQQHANAPKIGMYAYSGTDYHTVLKNKLSTLENSICQQYGPDSVSTLQHTFVDSAPVLERRWAQRAGLGWIGKHTQLINPGLGSYCFIGILLLNFETEYDEPIRNRCGSCTRCMDACPTQAIANGSMDARRCISYLTIENKEPVADEFREKLSGCVLGCDICARACPWNTKWAHPHSHDQLQPYSDNEKKTLMEWDAEEWLNLTEQEFSVVFKQSAVRRAGYAKLMQNIRFAFPSVDDKAAGST